ncbi:hypothetical protein D3C78_989540 [compost metagenome]
MVDTADVLDHAIAAVLRKVAGAVQAGTAFAERVGDEPQCGEVAAIQITTGQAGAADVQFTDAAFRHGVEVAVQQVPRQVSNRFADGAAGVLFQIRH